MAEGKVENTNLAGKSVISNPLLSGAGVTFPYEHFQNTSLFVPVPQPPEPLLIQDEGEVGTFVGQERAAEPQPAAAPPQSQERPPSATQRYTGLFSSIFGAINPQEAPPSEKPAEQASVSSTPRSYSPYVHVPNVTSYSPALYVPGEKSDVSVAATVSNAPQAALPPPPTAQFVPLTGNLYRQQPRQTKPVSALTPQRHFIPVSDAAVQRPATADSLGTDVLEDNAESTSSSNDSIVADLQSQFSATNISNPPFPIPVTGKSAEQAIQEEPFIHPFFRQNFENSKDLLKGDHSFLETSGRDFHESFGAVGQPVPHSSPENELSQVTQTSRFKQPGGSAVVQDDHRRPSYDVPWQGFGQVSKNTDEALKERSPTKKQFTEFAQEENPATCDNEKTFYDQRPLTEEPVDNFKAETEFYSKPNSVSETLNSEQKLKQEVTSPEQPPGPLFQQFPVSPASLGQAVPASGAGRFRRGGLSRRPVYAQVPGLSSGAPQENVFSAQSTAAPSQIFNPTIFQNPVVPEANPATATDSPYNPYIAPVSTFQNPVLSQAVSPPPFAPNPAISTAIFDQLSQRLPASTPVVCPTPPLSQPIQPPTSIFNQNSPQQPFRTPIIPPASSPPNFVFEQILQPASTPSLQPPLPEILSDPSTQGYESSFSPVPLASTPALSDQSLFSPAQSPPVQSPPPEPTAPPVSVFAPSSFFQPSEPIPKASPPANHPPAPYPAQTISSAAFFDQPQPQFYHTAPSSTHSSVSSFGAPPQTSSPAQLFTLFGQPPALASTPPDLGAPTQPLPVEQTDPLNRVFPTPTPTPVANPLPFGSPPKTSATFAPLPEPPSYFVPTTATDFFSGSTAPQASSLFDPPPHLTMAATPPEQLNTVDLSTPPRPARSPSPSVVPQRLLNLGQSGIIYRPPYFHWFWNSDASNKESWNPFSMADSMELEQAFNSGNVTMDTIVPTDGGRYDVSVVARRRDAVYWNEPPKDVRRCSWFHRKSTESKPSPYDENTAYTLEEAYKAAVQSGTWHRRVELPDGEHVVMYGPSSIAHFIPSMPAPDSWEAATDGGQGVKRLWVVKRGVDEFDIDDGESPVVDHILFVVHGIGAACDLKFRTIEEAVNDFRQTSHQLVRTHYRTSMEQGEVNRVEVLPVSWHQNLHEETGVDEKLQKITLKSIPKLRNFTNDTLLDILFYTSPVYCQKIIDQVGQELNRLYALFKRRNPTFQGSASVAGHSLGSLILFDMLCHQKKPNEKPVDSGDGSGDSERRALTRTGSYVTGSAGTGQPYINYPQLDFHPNSFFAMGSPIGMFVTVRGIDSLGIDFKLPTCPGLYNIYHPFDPVAYRLEALINPELATQRPVLIPHHKGRKRMHLELRETMARMGADLKQRVVDTVRSTWNVVYQLTSFGRSEEAIRQEVDEAIATQLPRVRMDSTSDQNSDVFGDAFGDMFGRGSGLNVGVANQGRRVDYVLQEAPLESFNEYVSAITSHVCYWDSEDTVLFILKDIYTNMGIMADSAASIDAATAAEEQTDDLEGPPSPPSPSGFVDPTAAMSSTSPLQPPPMGGFIRK